MSYKIAVVSSNGRETDLPFGKADKFYIYEVNDEKKVHLLEIRENDRSCRENVLRNCDRDGGGCGDGQEKSEGHLKKLEQILDCRCIICKEFGFQIRKVLERKAIMAFDIEYNIDEALQKIAAYLERIDQHRPWTGMG